MEKNIKKGSINELEILLERTSKHSQYQILASNFDGLFKNGYNFKCTYETERMRYIDKYVKFSGKRVIDIGGNTGFFTFESVNRGAKHVDYYEGNHDHAEFVRLSAELFDMNSMVSVHDMYYKFDDNDNITADIAFLLNVVHHLGDDYGDNKLSIEKAKRFMINEINDMSNVTDIMIFQMGFNWKGNVELGLFDNGSKKEMIQFISEGVREKWNILRIGIAEKDKGGICYRDCNENNIERDDSLGEFLNRPLFIMERKNKR